LGDDITDHRGWPALARVRMQGEHEAHELTESDIEGVGKQRDE
jgi:hypothetical protein